MWLWEDIEEPSLAGPNVFRMSLPAVIEGFAAEFGTKDHRGSTFHLPPIQISDFTGIRGGNASWNLSARGGPGAYFDLSLLGITDGKKGEKERRFLVLSASGDVLKDFGWKHRYWCENDPDEWDDEDGSFYYESEVDDDENVDFLGSVSVKEATEKGWLFDGALHVRVELLFELLEAKPAPIPSKAAESTINNILNTLKNDMDDPPYSDFELISSDGQRIKTYKLLLASTSPVFKTMFDTDCKETREGCCKIEDADGETIKTMLSSVLGVPSVKFSKMSFKLVKKLAILADKYEMLPLKNDCDAQLASRIATKNVFVLLSYAVKYNSEPVKTAAFIFLENTVSDPESDEVVKKLKKIGKALCEEYLDHLHLRQTGQPRKRALEGEAAENDRKRRIMAPRR